jgi:glycosyltransferase involved in cell wall biosynthesis
MKILHLLYESKGDYFGIGGVGERAYKIYSYLSKRHDITLICKKYPGAKDDEIEGLRHIFLGSESKSLTSALLSYAYHSALFVKKHGDEFDIIIEDFSPAIPAFLNFYKKRPVVLQIQGYTGRKYFEKYNIIYSAVLYMLEKLRPNFYRNIIVVSEATKKRFRFNDKHNLQIISNGISRESLNIEPDESDYILYLGRIDIHQKGLDILLNAYKAFYRKFMDIRLIIAGDGRDMKKFKGIINSLPEDVQKNIVLAGWVEGEKKLSLLQNALMVVIPSRYETQGIVVLEAMAAGKPVVASDIPELRYIMEYRAGMSFKTGSPASLVRSMTDCIASEERKKMGEEGRKWVKDFTWENIALRYERFLQDALGEHV